MAIKVKDILEWPLNYTSGGFELTVKTAKKSWMVSGTTPDKDTWYQHAMLTDGHDEILASIELKGNVRILRNTRIRVIYAWRDEFDVNNKTVPGLAIDQWENADPIMSEPDLMTEAEEWYAARQKEIAGKCRYGIACAMITASVNEDNWPEVNEITKPIIDRWVEYIMTGE